MNNIPGDYFVSTDLSLKLRKRGIRGNDEMAIVRQSGYDNQLYIPKSKIQPDDTILCPIVYIFSDMYEALQEKEEIELEGNIYILEPKYGDNRDYDFVGYRAKDGEEIIFQKHGLKADRLAELVVELYDKGLLEQVSS